MRSLSMLAAAAIAAELAPGLALPNDASAEIAVGGIQLRNERRVAMRKERLYISRNKVKVDYEFINESAEDVLTEVAFPIPEYEYSPGHRWGDTFDAFKVTVGGKPVRVAREVRAFVGEREVTKEVLAAGLEIESLARMWQYVPRVEPDGRQAEARTLEQIATLPQEQKDQLRAKGLIGDGVHKDPSAPAWKVRILYHWVQHFPPGQLVKVSHEYTPGLGGASYLHTPGEACIDAALRKRLTPPPGERGSGITSWVKYILTTANTWKTPIRDFELLIDYDPPLLVSLCWDGKIEKAGPHTFRSVLKDFVPTKELTVYFYNPMF